MLHHSKRQAINMRFTMFVNAVCMLFLIKLKWPINKIIYDGEGSEEWGKVVVRTGRDLSFY